MSQNITKEGIEVKPGQVWRDLEAKKRFHMDRKRSIVAVADGYAVMCKMGICDHRTTRVAIRRMHKHANGWELVQDAKGDGQ